jgi:hypothetical protein
MPGFGGVGTDPSLPGGRTPQVNATNQTGIAPNGDVNQNVTNENNYYNIIMPQSPWQSFIGGLGFGTSRPTIDPRTGAYLVQPQRTGIIGWIQRLFRGY